MCNYFVFYYLDKKNNKMKLKIAVIAMAGILLASCGGNGPEKVVKEFFTALKEKNFDKAKSLATTESATVIDLMAKVPDMGGDSDDAKLEKVDCEVSGETATCNCYEKGNDKAEKMKLKKVDGNWKVSMSKADMAGEAMNGLGDLDMNDAMNTVNQGLEQLDGAGDKVNDALNQLENMGDELKDQGEKALETVSKELEKVTE